MENVLLKLLSISSSKTNDLESWKPVSLEDTIICLDLEIGDNKGSNMFYVIAATPQALKHHKVNSKKNKTLIISDYRFSDILKMIEKIINTCSQNTWDESCQELSKHFHWEYANHASS